MNDKEPSNNSFQEIIKNKFANWLLKNAPDSYGYYLGDSQNTIIERLNEIDQFFPEENFFEVDKSKLDHKIKRILSLLATKERRKKPEFLIYDKHHSNGIPKAIMGKNNYIKFLKAYGFEKGNNDMDLKKALISYISRYKELIVSSEDYDELYKWEAITTFQNNWDLKTDDLASMIDRSFPGNNNLWTSNNYYPIAMLKSFAEINSDNVTTSLNNLFNESTALGDRILSYKNAMDELLQERNTITNQSDRHHYQDGRTISLLLAFNAPSKHFLFKYGILKSFCKKFDLDAPKKGDVVNQILINNEISGRVKKILLDDKELLKIHENRLTNTSFKEDNYNLLTQDFIYSTVNYLASDTKYWLYAPGESAEKWEEFYNDGIMALGWDALGNLSQYNSREEIRDALISAYGGEGSKKNDVSANDDFINKMNIGDITITKKGRGELLGYGVVLSDYYYDNQRTEYKSCRKVDWKIKGNWKADFNLVLKTLTDITKYDSEHPDYDKYSDRLLGIIKGDQPKLGTMKQAVNTIFYGPPGTGKTFTLKDQYFEKYTAKETSLTADKHFENVIQKVSWWEAIAVALLELKKAKVSSILEHPWVQKKGALSNNKNIRATLWGTLQAHTIEACDLVKVQRKMVPLIFNKTEDSFWEILEEEVHEVVPELFDLINSVNDFQPNPDMQIERYEFVTFHQSFSYEDFIEGIKPIMPEDGEEASDLGYKIEDGVFKKLCIRADNDPENRYAIFIDEINRGNISQIFGELITLIERDKRKGQEHVLSTTLPYSKKSFTVPSNLDIYGTMNTADRSVEALDTALRRRFSFEEMMPNPKLLDGKEISGINLGELLRCINERVELLIDRDHTIGHSYFMSVNSPKDLAEVFNDKVLPLLQEYFYGDFGKIGLVLGKGFIQQNDNKKINFADFPYENSEDYKNDTFTLEKINEENIVAAIKKIVETEES